MGKLSFCQQRNFCWWIHFEKPIPYFGSSIDLFEKYILYSASSPDKDLPLFGLFYVLK